MRPKIPNTMSRTFQAARNHATAIVAVQVLDCVAYEAHQRAGVEGIRCGRMDLYEIWECCARFRGRLGVQKVDHKIAKLDAHHRDCLLCCVEGSSLLRKVTIESCERDECSLLHAQILFY